MPRNPGRFMGGAQDARKIAEAFLKGDPPEPARRGSATTRELARLYCDALVLAALRKTELLLGRKDLQAKDLVALLEALREHGDWLRGLQKEKRRKRAEAEPAPEKPAEVAISEPAATEEKPENGKPDLEALDAGLGL